MIEVESVPPKETDDEFPFLCNIADTINQYLTWLS